MSAGASVYSNITDPVTIDDLSAVNLTISGTSSLGVTSTSNLEVDGDCTISSTLIVGYGATSGSGNTELTVTNGAFVGGDLVVQGEIFVEGQPFEGTIKVQQDGSDLSASVDTLNFVGPGIVVSVAGTDQNVATIVGIASSGISVPGAAGQSSEVQYNSGGTLDGAFALRYNNLSQRVGIHSQNPSHELSITGEMSFTDAIRIGGESSSQGGDENSVYIGKGAGASINSRDLRSNVCIGVDAGGNITSGNRQRNVCVGSTAGQNLNGECNVIMGADAGKSIIGDYNVAIGKEAGINASSSNLNVFVGNEAGYSNSGDGVTAIGASAGRANDAALLVAVGYRAGWTNSGLYNTFLGAEAGKDNSSGEHNTFGGYISGHENSGGSRNTYYGSYSGQEANLSNNTYIGFEAGKVSVGSSSNTFVGSQAGSGALGSQNIFVGGETGKNNEGDFNTLIGYRAGYDGQTFKNNVFVGHHAGYINSSDNWNTYVGSGAGSGEYIIEGTGPGSGTVDGYGSLSFASNKLFLGSGIGSVTGSPSGQFFIYNSGRNTAVCDYTITYTGPNAYTIQGSTEGDVPSGSISFNFVGTGETISGSGSQSFTGERNVILGATNLPKSGDNQLVVGAGTSTWIYGSDEYLVGMGTDNPNHKLDVRGGIQQNLPKSSEPTHVRDMVFEYIDNFSIRLKVKCEDGVVRSCVLGLSE